MEANQANSKKDFKNKIRISQKEANKTKHWIRMIAAMLPEHKKKCRILWQEAHELTLIFAKISNSCELKLKIKIYLKIKNYKIKNYFFMSKKISIIFFSLFLLSFVFIFIPVHANALGENTIFKSLPGCFATPPTECTICDVIGMIVGVAKFILGFVGVLALLLFVWGGFGLIISAGNEEAIKKNKGVLIGTLVGIVIVFAAWQIVWLTVATLISGNVSVSGNGLTILNQNWNNICASNCTPECEEGFVCNEKKECVNLIVTPSPKTPQVGAIERGGECSIPIESKKCKIESPPLTCVKKYGEQKYICAKLNSLNPHDECIPLATGSECKKGNCIGSLDPPECPEF